jgi:outer membrane protein assembly factor BamD (BamD/ComL family)
MEVYARLSSIRLRKTDDPKVVQENIDELLKMARREKYEAYKDIIYYAAALIELERNGYAMAEKFLNKSIQFNTDNPDQRTRSFLLLSDMLYDTKAYGRSGFYYDSVMTNSLDSTVALQVNYRKPPTKTIYEQDRILFAQDSLQKIAALPEAERNDYIRALAKRLRKAKGLKDEVDVTSTGQSVNPFDIGKGTANLFDNGGKDFYFYNPQQRAVGFNDFKQKWGGRPNVDNWRRSTAVQAGFAQLGTSATTDLASAAGDTKLAPSKDGSSSTLDIADIYDPKDVSFDALSSHLPIDQAAVSALNESINEALLAKAKALQNSIEDLPEAIKVYEELLARLSENDMAQEVIFNLIYCYNKIGDTAKADAMRKRLNSEFKDSEFAKRANNPNLGTERANPAATQTYKGIYNEFIEGNFSKALTDKKSADSTYGNTYWNPQLLYIESVYYIKERQDSAAINRLNVLAATYPTSPLAEKARTMVNVLSRRQQIEDYLTKLEIVRATEDSIGTVPSTPVINTVAITPVKKDTNTTVTKPNIDSINAANRLAAANKARQDSIQNANAKLAASKAREDSLKQANLLKLAAAKAAKDSAAAALVISKKLRADSLKAATDAKLAAARSAKDSLLIVQAAQRKARLDSLNDVAAAKLAAAKAKQDSIRDARTAQLAAAKARQDSIKQAAIDKLAQQKIELAAKEQRRKDSLENIAIAKKLNDERRADSLYLESLKPKTIEGFTVKIAEPQSVMILLDKVDPIYLNECVTAFNRYHSAKLGGSLSVQKTKLNAEYSVVTVSSPSFSNAEAALNYIKIVKPKAATEIVPWLSQNKFSFYIVDQANLEMLKQNGNVAGYLKALKATMPNKF